MTTASIMPPDAGIPVPPGDPRLDALIRLPPGRKRQDEVTRIIAELAESLAPLHAAGRVHGGIYPAALVFAGTKDGVASDGVALDGVALDRTVPDASSQAMLATGIRASTDLYFDVVIVDQFGIFFFEHVFERE